MSLTPKMLFDFLQKLNIEPKVYQHEPLYTVEQAKKAMEDINYTGAQCKNLFLKDNQKRFWLIVALADTRIELKKIAKKLQAPGLHFAHEEQLMAHLGVGRGAVTPFGLINDKEHAVTVILDSAIFDHDTVGFHPLTNDVTVTITPDELRKFIKACGNELIVYDFNQVVYAEHY